MKRQILLASAWVVAGAIFWAALVLLDFAWNWLTWSPDWNRFVMAGFVSILAGLLAMWFLGRTAGGRALQVVSLIVCLVLLGAVPFFFPAEPVARLRTEASPLWYRSGISFLMLLPTVFWLCGPLRIWNRRRTAKST